MSVDEFKPGTIRRLAAGGFEGVLQREFDHAPAELWRRLTESAAMAEWLAPGSIDQRPGGTVRIDFADSGQVIDSHLLDFTPGRVLAYSWSRGEQPERPLRWELFDVDAGTRLVLSVRVPADEDIAKACAGFEGHLEMLAAALEGVPIKFPFDLFLAARKSYSALVAQSD